MKKKICYLDIATAKKANWIKECFSLFINAFDISMIVL